MIQVINNEIVATHLPRTGTLKDGRTVSGYHLLDAKTLQAEGWLPVVDVPPKYDPETEVLIHTGYDIQEKQVVKVYEIGPKPEPEPDALAEMMQAIDILLGVTPEKQDRVALAQELSNKVDDLARRAEPGDKDPTGRN